MPEPEGRVARGAGGEILLEARSVSKLYPGVQALDGVRLDVRAGEIHALVGENGAGKSTLIKILCGAESPDTGTLLAAGEVARFRSPRDAYGAGVSVVHQELANMPHLSVCENILFGSLPTRFGRIRWTQAYARAREVVESLGVELDVRQRVGDLSLGQQQIVEIARALASETRVLILDEPSAVLGQKDVELLFGLIRSLRDRGIGCVYVSHRMSEIFDLSDRVTVLKDGRYVTTRETTELDETTLVTLMTGRELDVPERREKTNYDRTPLLSVRDATRSGHFEDVSFDLWPGEVVGLAGLVGAGRSEVARAISGMDRLDYGEVALDGERIRVNSPAKAQRHGIGLLPENRKDDGLLLNRSIRENIGLASLKKRSVFGLIKGGEDRSGVQDLMRQLDIRATDASVLAMNLSGGNQQKVLLARSLAAELRVLILDEPTRGVDVGAKSEIYALIHRLTDAGTAVLMISSEIEEIVSMSDRVLVMREGRLVAEFRDERINEDEIMQAALIESAGSGVASGEGER